MAIKKIIFVASYPPRKCGIATFTQDLLTSMRGLLPDVELRVCALKEPDSDSRSYPPEVMIQIEQDDRQSYIQAATKINQHASETIVIIQHEYGIYGGVAGEFLIDFITQLKCPVITTLHTVIDNPNPEVRKVTKQI